MRIYPSNTVTYFITRLLLSGDWEVGLEGIQCLYAWSNIGSEKTKPALRLGMKDYASIPLYQFQLDTMFSGSLIIHEPSFQFGLLGLAHVYRV